MHADDIREVDTPAERDAALPVMAELFPDLDPASFAGFFEDDRYRLFAARVDGAVVGLLGLSVRPVMHHERHVWVHDLVVAEGHRGEGHGRALLAFAEDWAADRDLDLVALALREGNEGARRFYEAAGYERWGDVYERRP